MPAPLPPPPPAEALGPALAQLLAPYLIAEMRRLGALPPAPLGAPASPQTAAPAAPVILYDDQTCAVFASGLGDNVLRRALVMFRLLAAAGQFDSTALLRAIPEAKTTPHLAGLLTNHLKHRSKAMGLRYPWRTANRQGRVVWADFDGIAGRMVRALEQEEQARQLQQPPAVPAANAPVNNGA